MRDPYRLAAAGAKALPGWQVHHCCELRHFVAVEAVAWVRVAALLEAAAVAYAVAAVVAAVDGEAACLSVR